MFSTKERAVYQEENLVGKISPELVRVIASANPQIKTFFVCRYDIKIKNKDDYSSDPTDNALCKLISEYNGIDILSSNWVPRKFEVFNREEALNSLVYWKIARVLPSPRRIEVNEENASWWTNILGNDPREDGLEYLEDYPDDPAVEAADVSACLSSYVELESGKSAHIPMIDFIVPIELKNINEISKVLKDTGNNGFLVNSGNSFHFLGLKIKSVGTWRRWLRSMLKTDSPFYKLVDRQWVEFCLNQKNSFLRIAPSVSEMGQKQQPKVVAVI